MRIIAIGGFTQLRIKVGLEEMGYVDFILQLITMV